jgi:transcriptional regulator with XRE-family HTH domain
MSLGERIRKRRRSLDMTQAQLAKKIDRTSSYISQVELGYINPSLTRLRHMANALGVPVAYFFDSSSEPSPEEEFPFEEKKQTQGYAKVVRKAMRKRLIDPRRKNIEWELLSPDLQRKLEVLYVTYQPGAETDSAMGHEGEECGVVLRGSLEANLDGEIYVLNEGDSICFESSRPHAFRNISDGITITIWVVTPPAF